MIPMVVSEEDRGFPPFSPLEDLLTEQPNPGTGVEDELRFTDLEFEAGRVPAVSDGGRPW